MQISKSERFIAEYKEIQNFISNCQNEAIKEQLTKLTRLLVSHVRILDNHHSDLLNLGKMPDDISNTRQELNEIRKKIFKLMKKT